MTQGNSPLDPGTQGSSPAAFPQPTGATQGAAGGELPGVTLPTSSRAKSSNTLVVSLVAIIAILVVALIFALIRPWDNGSQAPAAQESTSQASDSTAQQPSDEATTSTTATPTASQDSLQQQESKIAEEKGWVAGNDYVPVQPESGRTLIESIPRATQDSGFALGPEDAPVVVHMFADFSCPMCTKLHLESMADLEQLAHDGKIQLQWHNFVIFPEYGSDKAARGAVAAAHQGKLWEFVDGAFNTADPSGHPVYTDESVLKIARAAGVADIEQFTSDFNAADTASTVEAENTLAGDTLGLTGTPALFINGSYVSGAYPLDVILNTIEMQTRLAKG